MSTQKFYCECCNYSVMYKQAYNKHLNTQKHKNKLYEYNKDKEVDSFILVEKKSTEMEQYIQDFMNKQTEQFENLIKTQNKEFEKRMNDLETQYKKKEDKLYKQMNDIVAKLTVDVAKINAIQKFKFHNKIKELDEKYNKLYKNNGEEIKEETNQKREEVPVKKDNKEVKKMAEGKVPLTDEQIDKMNEQYKKEKAKQQEERPKMAHEIRVDELNTKDNSQRLDVLDLYDVSYDKVKIKQLINEHEGLSTMDNIVDFIENVLEEYQIVADSENNQGIYIYYDPNGNALEGTFCYCKCDKKWKYYSIKDSIERMFYKLCNNVCVALRNYPDGYCPDPAKPNPLYKEGEEKARFFIKNQEQISRLMIDCIKSRGYVINV